MNTLSNFQQNVVRIKRRNFFQQFDQMYVMFMTFLMRHMQLLDNYLPSSKSTYSFCKKAKIGKQNFIFTWQTKNKCKYVKTWAVVSPYFITSIVTTTNNNCRIRCIFRHHWVACQSDFVPTAQPNKTDANERVRDRLYQTLSPAPMSRTHPFAGSLDESQSHCYLC